MLEKNREWLNVDKSRDTKNLFLALQSDATLDNCVVYHWRLWRFLQAEWRLVLMKEFSNGWKHTRLLYETAASFLCCIIRSCCVMSWSEDTSLCFTPSSFLAVLMFVFTRCLHCVVSVVALINCRSVLKFVDFYFLLSEYFSEMGRSSWNFILFHIHNTTLTKI